MIPTPSRKIFLVSLFMSTLTVLSLSLVTTARASDFQSPRTVALGGAGHAAPLLTDSIYLNPSFAPFLPTHLLSANYGFFNGGDQQNDSSIPTHGHISNLAVQDGTSPLFSAGLAATIEEEGKILDIGASKSFLGRLGVGIGGKFLFPNRGNGNHTQDSNISTTFLATPWFQAMFMVDNIFDGPAMRAQHLYREYLLGTKFNIMNIMLIYLDPHIDQNVPDQSSFGYESGIELTPFVDFFIRFGMFRNSNIAELNNLRGRGYGFGLGWIGPRMSIDYGIRRVLDPVTETAHFFGVTIFY